jgi:multiple sugar transport system substrate-binding protein
MTREASMRNKKNRVKPVPKRSVVIGTACTTLAAGAALMGLSPTVSSAATRSPNTSTITLQFWNQYNEVDGEQNAIVHVVIPAFEKANPGIKVQSDYYNDNVIEQKFIAAAAAGSPPDVMRVDIADVPALAAQGTLTDLGKALPNLSQLTAEALPGPLATTEWKGHYYALPLDTNTQALFWNKELFKAAGLSGAPKTMTQLVADATKLTDKATGAYGLGVDGTDIWNVAPYIWSWGGQFTNTSLTKASGYMDGAATESAVKTLVGLYTSGVIGHDILGGSSVISGEEGFPKGDYAMYIDGPWAVPTFAKDKDVPPYGIALFPSGPGGTRSTVGGEDVVIPAGTKNAVAAEKFAEYLDQPLSQLEMAKQGDMSVEKNDAAGEVRNDPYDAIFAQQLLTAEDRPVVPGYQTLDTDFSDQLQKILAGKESVDAGLTAAAQEANSALATS